MHKMRKLYKTIECFFLFYRYYQIRCNLKPPEKYVSCVDVEYRRTNGGKFSDYNIIHVITHALA